MVFRDPSRVRTTKSREWRLHDLEVLHDGERLVEAVQQGSPLLVLRRSPEPFGVRLDRVPLDRVAAWAHRARRVAQGRGTVINIGSVAGEFPYPGGNVYGATKAFVHQFTQNLNADLVGSGVRATCIEPGLCGGTEFSNVRFAGDDNRAKAVYAGTMPLTAQDIADTVHWVVTRPAHVTINALSMMPNCQSFSGMTIKRTAN